MARGPELAFRRALRGLAFVASIAAAVWAPEWWWSVAFGLAALGALLVRP